MQRLSPMVIRKVILLCTTIVVILLHAARAPSHQHGSPATITTHAFFPDLLLPVSGQQLSVQSVSLHRTYSGPCFITTTTPASASTSASTSISPSPQSTIICSSSNALDDADFDAQTQHILTWSPPSPNTTWRQVSGTGAFGAGLASDGRIRIWWTTDEFRAPNSSSDSNTTSIFADSFSYITTAERIDKTMINSNYQMMFCGITNSTPLSLLRCSSCFAIVANVTCTDVSLPTQAKTAEFELVETSYDWTCGSLVVDPTATTTNDDGDVVLPQAQVMCWYRGWNGTHSISPPLPTIENLIDDDVATRTIPIAQLLIATPSTLFILYQNGLIWEVALNPKMDGTSSGKQSDDYLPTDETYRQIAVSTFGDDVSESADTFTIAGLTYDGTLIWFTPFSRTRGVPRRLVPVTDDLSFISIGLGLDTLRQAYACFLTRSIGDSGIAVPPTVQGQGDLNCMYHDLSGVPWIPSFAQYQESSGQCTIMPDGSLYLSVGFGQDESNKLTRHIYPSDFHNKSAPVLTSASLIALVTTVSIRSGCCVLTPAQGVSCVVINKVNATVTRASVLPPNLLADAIKYPISQLRSDSQNRICVIYENGQLLCRLAINAQKSTSYSGEPVPGAFFSDVTMNENGRVCVVVKSTRLPVCAASLEDLNTAYDNRQLPVTWVVEYWNGTGLAKSTVLLPPLPNEPVAQAMITYETEYIPSLLILYANGTVHVQTFLQNNVGPSPLWNTSDRLLTASIDANVSNTFTSLLDAGVDGQCAVSSGEGTIECWKYPYLLSSTIGMDPHPVPSYRPTSQQCTVGGGGTCGSPDSRRRLLTQIHDYEFERRWAMTSFSYNPSLHCVCGITVDLPKLLLPGQMICYDLTTTEDKFVLADIPLMASSLAINGSYLQGNQVKTCPLGTFSSDQGAINAICTGPCTEGTYGNTSSTDEQCSALCPSGSFCPLGSPAPTLCPAGTFGASDGLVDSGCTDECPVGYYCELGASDPITCGAGLYGSETALEDSSCSGNCSAGYICTPGSISPDARPCGASSFYCPEASGGPSFVTTGHYGDQPANATDLHANHTFTVRQICPPGYSCSGDGSKSECPIGTYSIAQSSYCTSCGTGRYQNETGQSTCIECATGKYQSDNGQTECHLCPAGKFSFDSLGAVYCQSCSPGSASNVTGLYSPDGCPPCPAGSSGSSGSLPIECTLCSGAYSYSKSNGSSSCSVCTVGMANADHTDCIPDRVCPPNNYLNSSTQSCVLCPLGKTSQQGARDKCLTCPYDTYTPGIGSGCISCNRPSMVGITCINGLASVRAGYWAYLEDATDEADLLQFDLSKANKIYQVYATSECPNQFCPGADLHVKNKTTNVEELTTANQCVSASRRLLATDNLLCAECADGYITWYGSCVSCSTVQSGAVILLLVISFLFTLFLYYSSGGLSAGVSTIILYFVQTAQLEVGETSNILAWIRIVNLNVSNTGGSSTCLGPLTPYQQTVLAILTPVILLAELGVIMIIHYIGHRFFSSKSSIDSSNNALDASSDGTPATEVITVPEERDYQPSRAVRQSLSSRPPATTPRTFCIRWLDGFSMNRYFAGCLSILLFTYTQVATTCLSFLHCVRVGALGHVVFGDPAMRCDSDSYHAVSGLVIAVLIVYICLGPFILLFFVGRHRDWIVEHSTAIAPRSAQYSYLIRFAPLISPFHARAWYWSLLVLVKRLSFVIVNTFLILDPSIRACLFILLNFVSYSLQVLIQPFKTVELNRIDQFSHISLVIISALLSIYPHPPYSSAVQILLFILIVPLPCLLLLKGVVGWCSGHIGNDEDLDRMKADARKMEEQAADEVVAPKQVVEMQEMPASVLNSRQKQHQLQEQHDQPLPSTDDAAMEVSHSSSKL